MIEAATTNHLIKLFDSFSHYTGLAHGKIGLMAGVGHQFYARLHDPEVTYTVKLADRALTFFAENWPRGQRPMPRLILPARRRRAA